jgi:cytochrome c oxidase subunit 2
MLKLLILLVIVLGIVAVMQLARVYELSSKLRRRREEDISLADNRLHGALWIVFMIVFYVSFILLMVYYGNLLPESASEHGKDIDWLMNFNMWLIIIAFFLVNSLLFIFANKYYYREDRKADFYPHNTKLELIWTTIPAVTMAVVIVYGLQTWNAVTDDPGGDRFKNMEQIAGGDFHQVEVSSKQFNWTVRYPGVDRVFGASNFNMIDADLANPLGMINEELMRKKLHNLDSVIHMMEVQLEEEYELLPNSEREYLAEEIAKSIRHKQRILDLERYVDNGIDSWSAGADDVVIQQLHLPVNKEVELVLRSQDVIHSAYMPHFRAQMNSVPGVPTRIKMTPTITTNEMREKLDDPDFDYILLCNKICGASHFNMKIPIVIHDSLSYDTWMKEQVTLGGDTVVDALQQLGEVLRAEDIAADLITNQ